MVVRDDIDAEQIPLFRPEQLPNRKTPSKNAFKAQRIINSYAVIAGGIGFIPLARVTGQVAIGGLLFKLLRELCRIYSVSFTDQQNKILIATILGGAHYDWISRYLLKFIGGNTRVSHVPASLLLRPAVSGLLVYHIGRLFFVHFESGVWHTPGEKT